MVVIANGAVAGSVAEQITAISASYTVVVTDQFIQVTTGGSNAVITVSLPAPSATNTGQRVAIQKIDSANGTVTCAGTLNIGKVYGLNNRWSTATFVSDGTNWNLVGTVS